MSPFDLIIVILFFASTAGVVIVRAFRSWRRFRLQERTVRLLARGLMELERPGARDRR
ncbi:MAG: hypothetical protein WD826_09405 [Actinomycetota bacterium]